MSVTAYDDTRSYSIVCGDGNTDTPLPPEVTSKTLHVEFQFSVMLKSRLKSGVPDP